jgi:hypothetical protein
MIYKIIDNITPISFQNKIKHILNDINFPWYFSNTIAKNPNNFKYNSNVIDAPGFTNSLWNSLPNEQQSNLFHIVSTILYFFEEKTNFKIKEIIRIRIRKTIQYPGHDENKFTPPHVDLENVDKYYSLVYYVDDSDGDTFLFKNKYEEGKSVLYGDETELLVRVPPKKGRALFFDGKTYHSGNCPINYQSRTIINFDFTLQNNI